MNEPQIAILDLTGCKSSYEMHMRIKQAFDFPDWYGENWDAFWDLLREPNDYTVVEIKGLSQLPEELKPGGEMMVKIFEDNRLRWDEYMQANGKFDRRFEYKIID